MSKKSVLAGIRK